MDDDEESAALHHQWELEMQESKLDEALKNLEELNKRQNKRFNLQEKDKCYLQKRQAKISP